MNLMQGTGLTVYIYGFSFKLTYVMKKKVNDDCITLALYFLFHAYDLPCQAEHHECRYGLELVLHDAREPFDFDRRYRNSP